MDGYTGAQLGIRKQNENRRAHEILQRRSNVRFLVETVVKYFLPVTGTADICNDLFHLTSRGPNCCDAEYSAALLRIRPYADLEITIRCNLESVVQQTTCMNVVM